MRNLLLTAFRQFILGLMHVFVYFNGGTPPPQPPPTPPGGLPPPDGTPVPQPWENIPFNGLVKWGFVILIFLLLVTGKWYYIPLLIAILYLLNRLGKHDTFLTTVPEGEMKFIMENETLTDVILNVRGFFFNKRTSQIEAITPTNSPLPNDTWRRLPFGLFWVGILPEITTIHKFKIIKDRIKDPSQIAANDTNDIGNMIEHEGEVETPSLRFRISRPVLVDSVELSDVKVDFLVMVDFEVVNPVLPVFTYKGRFTQYLDSDISGAVNDYTNGVSYADLITRQMGRGSEFSSKIMEINHRPAVANETNNADGRKTIIEAYGLRCVGATVYKFELIASQKAFADALLENKRQELLGQAAVTTARFKALADLQTAVGRRALIAAELDKLKEIGVSPDAAAQAWAATQKAESIRKSNLATYVEGNSGIQPNLAIPATPPQPPAAPNPAPTPTPNNQQPSNPGGNPPSGT